MIVAIVSVQCGAAIAKHLFPVFGATGAAALRSTFGAVIVALAVRPWRHGPPKGGWRPLLLFGVMLGAMNICLYLALQRVPLGIVVALEFSGPLAVAAVNARRALDLVWLLLAIAGLALLLPIGIAPHRLDPIGVAFALLAGLCWALYIVFGRRVATGNPMQAAALGMGIAAATALPVGLPALATAHFTLPLLGAAAAVGLLSSALPYPLEMLAMRRLPAHSFGTLMSLEPAIAALSGLVFLGEMLSFTQLVAIGLIMVASIGTSFSLPARA